MKNMEYIISYIVKKLLVVLIVSSVCNEVWINQNTIYYITEVGKWISIFGIVILEMVKIEVRDYLFQKEWSLN